MTDNVASMSKKSGNATMCSPEDALKDALGCIGKEGSFKNGKKLLILALDESDEEYRVTWVQAGMKMSQCVALCEVAKTQFLSEMNYINIGEG